MAGESALEAVIGDTGLTVDRGDRLVIIAGRTLHRLFCQPEDTAVGLP